MGITKRLQLEEMERDATSVAAAEAYPFDPEDVSERETKEERWARKARQLREAMQQDRAREQLSIKDILAQILYNQTHLARMMQSVQRGVWIDPEVRVLDAQTVPLLERLMDPTSELA